MVPNNYTLGVSISSLQGVVITPLGRRVTKQKRGSGRRGLDGRVTIAAPGSMSLCVTTQTTTYV